MKKSGRQDNRPSFQFYPDDWLSDAELSMVSIAAQGAWIRILCYMFKMPQRGVLRQASGKQIGNKEVSKLLAIPEQEAKQILDELIGGDVCSTLDDGTIYSRRMFRDFQISRSRAEAGRLGGSKQKPSKTEAPRAGACPSPSPSPSPSSTSKKEKEGDTPTGVSVAQQYFHLDPFPNKDIRDNLGVLRELMLSAHDKGAVLPAVGSAEWFRHLDALEKLVRLDGYSGTDIVDCLIWVLTKEKPSADGFCWRDQLKSLAQLRKHKPDGPTKFAQMHGAWRKATHGNAPEITPAQAFRAKVKDHCATEYAPDCQTLQYSWPWCRNAAEAATIKRQYYPVRTEADYALLVQRVAEFQAQGDGA